MSDSTTEQPKPEPEPQPEPGQLAATGIFATTAPSITGATVKKDIAQKKQEDAKRQFDDEIAAFRQVVFGGKTPRVPSAAAVGSETAQFLREMSDGQDRMIVHSVGILRACLMKGETAISNATKAAGFANAAWDCSQRHLEAWGEQQALMHKFLFNTRECLRRIAAGEDLSKDDVLTCLDAEASALEGHKAMHDAMERAMERLVKRAEAEAEAAGKQVRTAESFSEDMTAKALRHHGQHIGSNATAGIQQSTSKIQVVPAGTPIPRSQTPKWNNKGGGKRHGKGRGGRR